MYDNECIMYSHLKKLYRYIILYSILRIQLNQYFIHTTNNLIFFFNQILNMKYVGSTLKKIINA